MRRARNGNVQKEKSIRLPGNRPPDNAEALMRPQFISVLLKIQQEIGLEGTHHGAGILEIVQNNGCIRISSPVWVLSCALRWEDL